MDYSPPGSSVHGISQARILEWVAIFFYFFSPRNLLNIGMEPMSPSLKLDSLPLGHLGSLHIHNGLPQGTLPHFLNVGRAYIPNADL